MHSRHIDPCSSALASKVETYGLVSLGQPAGCADEDGTLGGRRLTLPAQHVHGGQKRACREGKDNVEGPLGANVRVQLVKRLLQVLKVGRVPEVEERLVRGGQRRYI